MSSTSRSPTPYKVLPTRLLDFAKASDHKIERIVQGDSFGNLPEPLAPDPLRRSESPRLLGGLASFPTALMAEQLFA
jgi:hypothetical protein